MKTLLPRIYYKDRRWRVRSLYEGQQITQKEHWHILLALMDAHTFVNYLNSWDPREPVYYLKQTNALSNPPAPRGSK